MTLSEAYECLRDRFGSHCAAAKHLGMTEQHYNALRNGRANMPARTANYILMSAQEAFTQQPLPQSSESPGTDFMTAS